MKFLRKLNPITLYNRALDVTDEWVRRTSYQGVHWATA